MSSYSFILLKQKQNAIQSLAKPSALAYMFQFADNSASARHGDKYCS